jgi:hypothetical protein
LPPPTFLYDCQDAVIRGLRERLFDSESSGERLEIQVQQELGNPTSAMSFVVYLNVLNNLTNQKKKLQKQQQKWGKTKIQA